MADEYKDDCPVIPCKKVGSELVFLRPCPYCGQKHRHGAGNQPPSRPPWIAGHRVAHCPPGGEIKRGRKYVKVPPEAERGYILEVIE